MNYFSAFNFSNKEIDMIANLMKSWVSGSIVAVKRTTLTKQVIQYALVWRLLEVRADGRLYFPQYSGFNAVYDLPIEVLWKVVEPMLNAEGQTGFSIVNNAQWEMLNIYPQNSRHATDKDLEAKRDIMIKLSAYHYIYFQMAGSTWCIYREERTAA